ncbi:hypothetical protein E1297_04320 [Roseibium sp. RKSG952]|nr:hypothetical protein [Roseibium sp. RKSG952]
MYDWPELKGATAQLENALGTAVAEALGMPGVQTGATGVTGDLMALWTDPDMLLAQTCGYPLVSALKDAVTVIGTPHYDAPGCEGPLYCSHVLVRADSPFQTPAELRGTRAAFNSTDSQSGHNAFRHVISPLAGGKPFFSEAIETGGHLRSMAAVAGDDADVCCIDAVCWGLLQDTDPELASRLRPLAQSRKVPGLPFVTTRTADAARLQAIQAAVKAVLTSAETQESRKRLGICGFSFCSFEDYRPLSDMRSEALSLGYPVLR